MSKDGKRGFERSIDLTEDILRGYCKQDGDKSKNKDDEKKGDDNETKGEEQKGAGENKDGVLRDCKDEEELKQQNVCDVAKAMKCTVTPAKTVPVNILMGRWNDICM